MAIFRDVKLNAIDENVEDKLYINQICKAIIAVPVGSIPLVEDFGSQIPLSIDAPFNAKTKAKLQTGSFDALDGVIEDLKVTAVLVAEKVGGGIQVKPTVLYKGQVIT